MTIFHLFRRKMVFTNPKQNGNQHFPPIPFLLLIRFPKMYNTWGLSLKATDGRSAFDFRYLATHISQIMWQWSLMPHLDFYRWILHMLQVSHWLIQWILFKNAICRGIFFPKNNGYKFSDHNANVQDFITMSKYLTFQWWKHRHRRKMFKLTW